MNYIDIHNHVLPLLDDGAKSFDDAVMMLKQAEKDGIAKIIVTPHYKSAVWINGKETINLQLSKLKGVLKEEQINIELYPGSEIFLSNDIADLLSKGFLQTLNNSRYILVEMSYLSDFWTFNLKEELYNLKLDGYKIILAHPERYDITYNKPGFIYELVEEGHYMQINVSSLNPRHAGYKIVNTLLEHNLVHFVASDAHSLKHRPIILSDGYQYICKNYGKAYADDLFYHNPLRVLEDADIKLNNIKRIKERKFLIFSK